MKAEDMKTVNIKGKNYVEVNERIKYFRTNTEAYPQGKILTSIESMENGICVVRAEIYVNDQLVSTGHAYEKEGSTFINKTSYLENCETSAIGRALGILGIGIDTSIASSEEVQNAVKQQKQPQPTSTEPVSTQHALITEYQKDKIIKLVQENKIDLEKVKAYYKVASLDELNFQQANAVISKGNKK